MSACKSKRWFRTKEDARRKVKRLKSKNSHQKLEVYRCPECQGFHLTSKTNMEYKVTMRSRKCADTAP